jgi:hypothetical protein
MQTQDSNKVIVLFGPPGSGKSTLVGLVAAKLRFRCIDVEALWKIGNKGGAIREMVLQHLNSDERRCHGTVVGAAGTQPGDYHEHTFKVLLLPTFEDYERLVAVRSKCQASKYNRLGYSGHCRIYRNFERQLEQDPFLYHKVVTTPCLNKNVKYIINDIADSAKAYMQAISYDPRQRKVFGVW